MARLPRATRSAQGDVLEGHRLGHEDLTRLRVVTADGRMPFPLIGEVQAAGLTPSVLEARMRELLAKEIPGARTIVARESKEAIRLDARALPAVAQLLTEPAVEADLLSHALSRDPATLVDLSRVLEARGRLVTAAPALEDALAIAATPRQKASVTRPHGCWGRVTRVCSAP